MSIDFVHVGGRSGERLFVLIHGMEHKAADLQDLSATIHDAFPQDHILLVTYPSSRWSNTKPLEIAGRCVAAIQSEFDERGGEGYREVILVGHSLGALFARKICLLAHGICSDYAEGFQFSCTAKSWENRITRLVLLAGMSRGWKLRPRNRHTPRARWIARGMQLGMARALGWGSLVLAAHRGSPFIVNLRLDWLTLVNKDKPGKEAPKLVVQLAGLHDTVVHPTDHIDLLAGRNFQYLSIEGTRHEDMVRFDDAKHGAERRAKFLYALHTAAEDFQGELIPEVQPINEGVTDAVLLLHGIRDYGKWQEDLRDLLEEGARQRGLRIGVSISNYDYLPLLPFLFNYGRRLHIERFMDRYAEMRSQYPKAKCSFAGHSNGTYLLAIALRKYRASKFERVAFMGSIVQRNFPWLNQFGTRVTEVRNYVASADAVVAIFPSLFEMIRLVPLLHGFPNRDFGSSGHTGFTQVSDKVRNLTYIEGGHGAALGKPCRDSLVSFLLGDSAETRARPPLVHQQNGWVGFSHHICVLIWLAMVAVCTLAFYGSLAVNARLGWHWPLLPAAVGLVFVIIFFRI